MSCDFRFASENARFGQPEILIGLIPGLVGMTFATGTGLLLVSGFVFGFFLLRLSRPLALRCHKTL